MKLLGIITLVIGLLMLIAGMTGEFTQEVSHDTLLMVIGPIFSLVGIALIAYRLAKK